jgi:hypothetical protein
MTRYHRVPTSFWMLARDWEDRLRNLGLYVQTCEHRTTEGLYRLPLAYVAADLAWPTGVPARQMRNLVSTGFVRYDERAEVVLLPGALEVQVPTTENQIKGAVTRLQSVPPTPLLADFYALAVVHANGLAESMRMGMGMEIDDSLARASESDLNGHSNSLALTHAHSSTTEGLK